MDIERFNVFPTVWPVNMTGVLWCFACQVDKFTIEAVDLGQVYKIKIRHDNSMISPDWYLDQVEVFDVDTEEVFLFLCERWLSKKKEDKHIERFFYVKVTRNPKTLSGQFHMLL